MIAPAAVRRIAAGLPEVEDRSSAQRLELLVDDEELAHLLTQAWRSKAPKVLVKRYDAGVGSAKLRSS